MPISLEPKSNEAPSLAGMTLENDDAYKVTLSFGLSGAFRLEIDGLFNDKWGRYSQDEGKIVFGPFASTEMMPENIAFEREMANFLSNTSKMERDDCGIVFLDKNNRVLMRFKSAEAKG